MRTAIAIGAPGAGPLSDFGEISEYVREAELLGVDCVWSAEAHFEHLRHGAESAGRSLADLDRQVGTSVVFTEDPSSVMSKLKPGMAFTLGAMGPARTNFYNDAFRRAGWEDVCKRSQALWVEGKREEAAQVIPDEMILATNAVGDEAAVKARFDMYRDVGINTLQIHPSGRTSHEMLETLERSLKLIGS